MHVKYPADNAPHPSILPKPKIQLLTRFLPFKWANTADASSSSHMLDAQICSLVFGQILHIYTPNSWNKQLFHSQLPCLTTTKKNSVSYQCIVGGMLINERTICMSISRFCGHSPLVPACSTLVCLSSPIFKRWRFHSVLSPPTIGHMDTKNGMSALAVHSMFSHFSITE